MRRTGPKDWLWIKPDVGTAPTTVTVAILRDSLSTAGTFTGVDSVYATTAGVAPRLLQVTLTGLCG